MVESVQKFDRSASADGTNSIVSVRRRHSLQLVLSLAALISVLLPLTFASMYQLNASSVRRIDEAVSQHLRLTHILSLGAQKPLWDLSPNALVPLVESLVMDPRVISAVVKGSDGSVFVQRQEEIRPEGRSMLMIREVKNGDRVIGSVEVEFSLLLVDRAIERRFIEAVVVAAAQMILCLGVLLFVLRRRVVRPIKKLMLLAQNIANRELDQVANIRGSDEVGQLGKALEVTRQSLKQLFQNLENKNLELQSLNQVLETMVEDRAGAIKIILDHVQSGFMLIDSDGIIYPGYSKACEDLLGRRDCTGFSFVGILGLDETDLGLRLRMSFDQVFADILPIEDSLAQIPSRIELRSKILSLSCSPVREVDGEIKKILVSILDVSDLERAEAENRTNKCVITILQNIQSFRDFINGVHRQLASALSAIRGGNINVAKMEFHTIKGNAAAFGMEQVVNEIHKVEYMGEFSETSIQVIEDSIQAFLTEYGEVLEGAIRVGGDGDLSRVDLGELAMEEVSKARSVPEALSKLERLVDGWRLSPIATVLGPLKQYASSLAHERGKEAALEIRGSDILIQHERFRPLLQNLVHLVRNGIDHGLESAVGRGLKPQKGTLRLMFDVTPNHLIVKYSDDGKGIDEAKIIEIAIKRGILTADGAARLSVQERLRMVFVDGISTAEGKDTVSGQGVGMGALLEAANDLKGEIEISSQPGVGVNITIRLPFSNSEVSEDGLVSVA